jgi:hypothetical protein
MWGGVAVNSTPSIPLYTEIEVALCTMGIGLYWGGCGLRAAERKPKCRQSSKPFHGWR